MMGLLVAAADREIRTAVRTRMLWIAGVPLAALGLLLALASLGHSGSPAERIADAAVLMNLLGGLGLALASADRFRRHQRPGLPDLLRATPGSPLARLAGTLAGAVTATLVPMAAALLICGAAMACGQGSLAPLGVSAAAIPLVLLPGGLAVAALSALAGLVLPVIVARIAVIAVWGWATVLNSRFFPIPTISYTVFSPNGGFPAAAWLGGSPGLAVLRGAPASGAGAALNVVLVLAFAAAFIVIARYWTELDR